MKHKWIGTKTVNTIKLLFQQTLTLPQPYIKAIFYFSTSRLSELESQSLIEFQNPILSGKFFSFLYISIYRLSEYPALSAFAVGKVVGKYIFQLSGDLQIRDFRMFSGCIARGQPHEMDRVKWFETPCDFLNAF